MPLQLSPSALPDDIKEKVAKRANDVVLDLVALGLAAHKAHLNVRGENFGPLHDLFSSVYEACDTHSDAVAEFAAMLGAPVAYDAFDVAAGATKGIGPVPMVHDCATLCRAIFDATTTMLVECNAAADEMRELGARDGEQLLIDVSMAFHKLGWKNAAYLFEDSDEAMSRPGEGMGREPAMQRPAGPGAR